MTRLIVGLLISLLFENAAVAESNSYQKFLEKDSPNELYFLAQGGMQCMIQRSQLNEVVREELLKHKIRPVRDVIPPEQKFYLFALLECAVQSIDPVVFAYRLGVRFNSISSVTPEAFHVEYTDLGVSRDPDFVIEQFRKRVNEAILDYVEANLANF
ncbi:hypothetical protein [Marinobacter sp. SS5-14b]|uniref:hypothetical protein n=1 Tax=Marinobacter sp. SS5-14b TaxID=3050456 RepID=UPI0026DF63E2|nr:hypothetical protein [Marinobacter sp. SS5-14b]